MSHTVRHPPRRFPQACPSPAPALLLAALSAMVPLAGCQSAPPRSPAAEIAIRSHNQANAALARGDAGAAADGFRAAMRQAAALDDWRGEGESRIALAVSQQQAGRAEDARATLRPLIADMTLPYTPAQRRAALLRQAQWHLQAGDWQGLRDDLARVTTLCDSHCATDSAVSRLQAQLALHEGRPGDAGILAARAVRQAPADSDLRAQALRVQANIALVTRPADGFAPAEAALALDRRQGSGTGVFQDLLLRTWLAQAAGSGDTLIWLRRTCAVALAIGQPDLLAQIQRLPKETWHDHTDPRPAHARAVDDPDAGTAGLGDCRQP